MGNRRNKRLADRAKRRSDKAARMKRPGAKSKYALKRGTWRQNAQWWFSRGEIDDHRPGTSVG